MSRVKTYIILLQLFVVVGVSSSLAQQQYVGYVYPAGGQQGTTFAIRLGGQKLAHASDLVVSGSGVSVRLVDYYWVINNQAMQLLRRQLKELKKKDSTVSDALGAKMAWFEFPESVRPPEVSGLVCPACGGLSPMGADVCKACNAPLPKSEKQVKKGDKKETEKKSEITENELGKQNLIERIERLFAADERNPAVRAHSELVFAEVTIAPSEAYPVLWLN